MHFAYLGDTGDHAGWPRLDLAPRKGQQDHYGSIAFTQYDATDESYHTIEVNNLRNDYWVVEGLYTDPDDDEEFNGAVSIHPDSDPPMASISHFEWNESGRGCWDVTAARFELEDDPPDAEFLQVDTGIGVTLLDFPYDFVDFLQIETFQAGDIVTTNEDNAYWIGYCDKIDMTAVKVMVAYGDTTT